jgi:hypothetical protein
VAGPYASVNCTLTLLKSSIRKTAIIGDQYGRIDANDDRFSDHFGSLQSIVTSSAQNDSGMFESNLRDERYLPFENSGVISEWQLQLPADPSKKDPMQFDYNSISDVILHIRYSAREGGGLLRNVSIANLKELISDGSTTGSTRLFSIKEEFTSEWATFVSDSGNEPKLKIQLKSEHYPFWTTGMGNRTVRDAKLFAAFATDQAPDLTVQVGNSQIKASFVKDLSLGNLLVAKLPPNEPPSPIADVEFSFDNNSMDNLWLQIRWGS